jgi:hypothetical protein
VKLSQTVENAPADPFHISRGHLFSDRKKKDFFADSGRVGELLAREAGPGKKRK